MICCNNSQLNGKANIRRLLWNDMIWYSKAGDSVPLWRSAQALICFFWGVISNQTRQISRNTFVQSFEAVSFAFGNSFFKRPHSCLCISLRSLQPSPKLLVKRPYLEACGSQTGDFFVPPIGRLPWVTGEHWHIAASLVAPLDDLGDFSYAHPIQGYIRLKRREHCVPLDYFLKDLFSARVQRCFI